MSPTELLPYTAALTQAHRLFNKVFGIGANKTGTTTLQTILRDLGLKVAPQTEGELAGVACYRGQWAPLTEYIRRYDAFQDAPFSIKTTFAQVDALFPGSRFILTHRPPQEWFHSLLSYHLKLMGQRGTHDKPTPEAVQQYAYLFPGYAAFMAEINWLIEVGDDLGLTKSWDLAYHAEHYQALYVQRNQTIVRHFSERPQDLLVIDLTREADTRRIVEFLGLPDFLVRPVPHENKT